MEWCGASLIYVDRWMVALPLITSAVSKDIYGSAAAHLSQVSTQYTVCLRAISLTSYRYSIGQQLTPKPNQTWCR